MTTLTEFLIARIDEDEIQATLLSQSEQPDWSMTVWPHDGECIPVLTPAFHPARVLAECAAKRAIVELHDILGWTADRNPQCSVCAENEDADYDGAALVDWPCPTLRHLATIYAAHPEFRAEWLA